MFQALELVTAIPAPSGLRIFSTMRGPPMLRNGVRGLCYRYFKIQFDFFENVKFHSWEFWETWLVTTQWLGKTLAFDYQTFSLDPTCKSWKDTPIERAPWIFGPWALWLPLGWRATNDESWNSLLFKMLPAIDQNEIIWYRSTDLKWPQGCLFFAPMTIALYETTSGRNFGKGRKKIGSVSLRTGWFCRPEQRR